MIDKYEGKYRWLSNFYPLPKPSVEHFYQAKKLKLGAKNERGELWHNLVMRASSAGQAKRMLRHDVPAKCKLPKEIWDPLRLSVMRPLLVIKFSIPEMREKLLDTGTQRLVEGNWWHDNFFGVCYCQRCRDAGIKGENNLGKMQMEIREEII
jgi:ribA/ribD-fused uncharacterized protein